jgi:hypothetical protein
LHAVGCLCDHADIPAPELATLNLPKPANSKPVLPFRRRPMLALSSVFGPDDQDPGAVVVCLRPTPARAPAPDRYLPPVLPLPTRRFLDADEAAAYVGVSQTLFLEEVGQGLWPQPLRRGASGRRTTWDLKALDAAADLASGLVPAAASPAAAGAEAEALKRFR